MVQIATSCTAKHLTVETTVVHLFATASFCYCIYTVFRLIYKFNFIQIMLADNFNKPLIAGLSWPGAEGSPLTVKTKVKPSSLDLIKWSGNARLKAIFTKYAVWCWCTFFHSQYCMLHFLSFDAFNLGFF